MPLSNHYHRYTPNYWGRDSKSNSRNKRKKQIPIESQEAPIRRINALQDAIQAQTRAMLAMNLLPSLSTTQLEETKVLAQEANPQEGYVEFPPVELSFLPSVIIPRGFKLSDDTSKYDMLLSMDEHTLRIIQEEVYREAAISLEDEEGNPITLNASVKVIKVSVVGTIFYNVVMTGFEPKDPMYGDGETVFNSDPAIPINVVLGYTTNEEEQPLNEYVITVAHGEEYLITDTGERVGRNNPLFFQILQEGGEDMTMQVPSAVTVAASPPPIC